MRFERFEMDIIGNTHRFMRWAAKNDDSLSGSKFGADLALCLWRFLISRLLMLQLASELDSKEIILVFRAHCNLQIFAHLVHC